MCIVIDVIGAEGFALQCYSLIYVVAYIAEYCSKVMVCGWNDKCDDIQIENDSSQSNDVVEVRTRQTNQPGEGLCVRGSNGKQVCVCVCVCVCMCVCVCVCV